jgi:hypothetical protein
MKKINLPPNPFKSGIFVLMLGFFVNSLAIFMVLTQIMPRSVSAQTSGTVYYQEYWCAGEIYAGVNPSGYAGLKVGDNAIWQRFKRDCRWRAIHTYSPYSTSFSRLAGGDTRYSPMPAMAAIFDEFRTVTMSAMHPLYNLTKNTDWQTYLNIVAPQPFGYSYTQPIWNLMAGRDDHRSLNFSDQSAGGSESNNGFVTEWFVYGRIGTNPMYPGLESNADQFGSFENLLPGPTPNPSP